MLWIMSGTFKQEAHFENFCHDTRRSEYTTSWLLVPGPFSLLFATQLTLRCDHFDLGSNKSELIDSVSIDFDVTLRRRMQGLCSGELLHEPVKPLCLMVKLSDQESFFFVKNIKITKTKNNNNNY